MNLEIKLEKFEGPLDLLLHLIDKNKLSITDIPISEITDQYLSFMEQANADQMETLSEFVEMAARLLAIKAKMLLPKPKIIKEEEIDPRQELMEQLLEYKKYKMIARKLKEYSELAAKMIFKEASIPDEVLNYVEPVSPDKILADLDFEKLYQAFQMVMKRKQDKTDPLRSQFSEIPKEVISLEDKMKSILELRAYRQISFWHLLNQAENRPAMVITFLAILELMKAGEIRVEQSNLFADIRIYFREKEKQEGEA